MIVHNSLVTLKMPKHLKEKIIKEAKTKEIPLSEYIRRVIFNEIANQPNTVR